MGAWGHDPWDNDEAADWFGDLWEGSEMVDRVLTGLASDNGEQMMAALWLCSQLCRVYVWPIARFDETLTAAIAAADRLLAGDDEDGLIALWAEEDVDLAAQIKGYRIELAGRRTAD